MIPFILCLIIALAGQTFLNWFFRDGLGPDSVQSSGAKAWQYFWEGELPTLIIIGVPFLIGMIGFWISKKRIKKCQPVN